MIDRTLLFHHALFLAFTAIFHSVVATCGAAPAIGVVGGDALYCLQSCTTDKECDVIVLTRTALTSTDNAYSKQKFHIWSCDGELRMKVPIRLRVSHDTCWILPDGALGAGIDVRRVPISELLYFDVSNRDADRSLEIKYGNTASSYFAWTLKPAIGDFTIAAYSGAAFPGLRDKFDTDTDWMLAVSTKHAFIDSLPTSANSESTFLLYKGKCQVWDTVRTWPKDFDPKKENYWRMRLHDKPVETFDLGFTEPFQVFANGGIYFFVTASGKFYTAQKAAEEGKWNVVKAWAEDGRPIIAVITDTFTDRSYAFAQPAKPIDGPKGKSVYFPLDDKRQLVEFDLAKIKAIEGKAPLPLLRQLTQVLIDDKKITLNPPKAK